MRAAIYHNKQDVRYAEVAEPVAKDGQVLVEVEWCGICGSDLHLFQSGMDGFGELTKNGETLPYALGHEFVGRIRSPAESSGFKENEPVFVDPRLPCRKCVACKTGHDYGCPHQGGYGYNHGGGCQEIVAVPVENVHRLPDAVPLEYAALIEPFAIAVHAIRLSGVQDWSTQHVLLLGGGPVGFSLAIALRGYGPKSIIVSEPTSTRREQLGNIADAVLNPLVDDIAGRCDELTNGQGIDIVFDGAGVPAAMRQGLDALKFGGLYLNLAMWEKEMVLPVITCLLRHINIKFAMVYNADDIEETIRLFSQGKLKGYEMMVTKRIDVSEIVEKGFQELIHHKDDHVKILVTPKKREHIRGSCA